MEKLKVVGLMTVLTILLVGLGGYIGGNGGATLFFVISLAMNFGMYWFSDKIVLKQYKAHIIQPGEEGGRFDPLYEMVDRLRRNADMPMPVVAISEQSAAERLRHGPESEEGGRLRDARHVGSGHARSDDGGRAGGGDGARARAHPPLPHAGGHHRGEHGGCGDADRQRMLQFGAIFGGGNRDGQGATRWR
jgi:hypothetical protein